MHLDAKYIQKNLVRIPAIADNLQPDGVPEPIMNRQDILAAPATDSLELNNSFPKTAGLWNGEIETFNSGMVLEPIVHTAFQNTFTVAVDYLESTQIGHDSAVNLPLQLIKGLEKPESA